MDFYLFGLLFLTIMGCATIKMGTHLHGFLEWMLYAAMVFAICYVGSAAFEGTIDRPTLLVGKVFAVIGACGFFGWLSHVAEHHHSRLFQWVSVLAGLLISVGIVAYTPGVGFGSPSLPTLPAPRTAHVPTSRPGAGSATPPASSPTATASASGAKRKIQPIAAADVPCYLTDAGCPK